jgi:hypothetical protein
MKPARARALAGTLDDEPPSLRKKTMRTTSSWPSKGLAPLALLILLATLPPAAAAQARPAFVPISPCTVVDARGEEPLVEGAPRVLRFAAGSCPIPAGVAEVVVEVQARDASAPARLVAIPGGRSPVEPTTIETSPDGGGRGTVVVPVSAALDGLVAVQASFADKSGQARVGLDVVGYFEEALAFTGTTGFIRTRPTCVPPKYTKDLLNYLQGPEPIRLDNGDVTLLVGAGKCCTGHWEGLFSLNYPAAGRFATPRFRGIWATNDFASKPSRKEAEVGFPSALFYGGKWRIALSTTFLPFHRPDRERVGRIDLPDLGTRASTAQVTNAWVKPIDPACRQIASCPGEGSGRDPVLTLHPNGDLYLYHHDGNHPSCSSGYVRHRVRNDLTIDNSRDDGCVRFEGLTGAPFLISDIARTRDGRMLLLVEMLAGPTFISEWVSTGSAAQIGLVWSPTGRLWPAPSHPSGLPWSYYVRDAAFLKDKARTVVEPNVVVGQISDGRTYAEMADVQLGRWYLYYWADEGAVLPPTFGGPANGCAFQGTVEGSSCTEVRGWAWDPMFPTTPIAVEVLVDGVSQGTVPADRLRPDLATSGKGDGRHGFVWTVPAAVRNGKRHTVTVRFAESPDFLAGKKQTLNCR